MDEKERLQRVLAELESAKEWKLFNSLTDQGKKLVSDTLEVSDMVKYEEIFYKKQREEIQKIINKDPSTIIYWSLKAIYWGVFMIGLLSIMEKVID
jgi:predicted transcriptional regulator